MGHKNAANSSFADRYSLIRDEERDQLWWHRIENGTVSLGHRCRRRVERDHVHRRADQIKRILFVRAQVHWRELV